MSNSKDDTLVSGVTPLHYAAVSSNASMIIQLILDGADVNAQDSNGQTPLHYAAKANNLDAIRVFTGDKEFVQQYIVENICTDKDCERCKMPYRIL